MGDVESGTDAGAARRAARPPSWWRRNRVALLTLPLAAALAVGAGSSRLVEFDAPGELEDPDPVAAPGEPLPIRIEEGELIREATVTALGAAPVDRVEGVLGPEPAGAPEGSTVWAVDLRFEPAPGATLDFCRYAVIDDRDREIEFAPAALEAFVVRQDCVPQGLEPGAPRPQRYDVRLYAVLPEGAQARALRLWWSGPQTVRLDLSRP